MCKFTGFVRGIDFWKYFGCQTTFTTTPPHLDNFLTHAVYIYKQEFQLCCKKRPPIINNEIGKLKIKITKCFVRPFLNFLYLVLSQWGRSETMLHHKFQRVADNVGLWPNSSDNTQLFATSIGTQSKVSIASQLDISTRPWFSNRRWIEGVLWSSFHWFITRIQCTSG